MIEHYEILNAMYLIVNGDLMKRDLKKKLNHGYSSFGKAQIVAFYIEKHISCYKSCTLQFILLKRFSIRILVEVGFHLN